ncbi:E3 ubiquitin-protein ligase RNF103 isoform X2 [Dunckerocampus dactyliophorus]|uniref:E3 ubiquitin-protein ligase RNF103 isoform X2 n=1 Tax=Dunckerocampus dactyliophorus TaxID=161453 RepID=UPI0024064759|nr:E3 ubiquitin-protein ligase RNF103 isoform X2 [Dunckerocampus dactyliophorus]
MWLKLFFLLLYFIVLFMLARIFEAVVWYETGVFATQLVDPVSLSYKKLKTILECRGLAYTGLAEKKDVSQLVEKSGELTHGELYSAIKKEKEQTEAEEVSSTHFSGETHFYELVEDTKDGIWLVQVIAQDREALLDKSNWGKMVQKVSQFGIRTGTFNCSHDKRLCIRRGWERSTLIMSVPQTSASKGKVMLKEYNGRRIETEHIFRWMTSHMSHRIKTLCDTEKLLEEWHPDPLHPLKMFLFAPLPQPPVFFSSLSVKFTGRIEFIFVDVRHWDNQSSLLEIGVTQSAAYILKMPEGLYHYGNSTGEFLSVAAMDTFLRSVQPEVNDLFVLSLVLINLLAWMDLFITQALLQLSYLESLYGYSLKLLRYADTTTLASLVRTDWTFYSSHPALFLSTYLAHGLLVDYFEKKRRCGNRTQEDSSTNLEWLASLWEWYTSYLLHPIASLQQVPLDWEDDPNLLFERLAFPDLWLRPLVSVDYIKALPTWKFRCCGADPPDGKLEEDTDNNQLTDRLPYRPPQSSKRQESTYNHDGNMQSACRNVELPCTAEALLRSGHLGDTDSPLIDGMLEQGRQTKESISQHEQSDWSAWPCNMLQCSECVVCLENFVSEELLMGLPCGHAFHQQCIVVWLAAGRHCCPVCRWPSCKKKEQPLVHRSHSADI